MTGLDEIIFPMIEKINFKGETFHIFKNDNGVSKTIKQNESFGFSELKIYKDILGEDDVFVDVGLNIGAISFQLKKERPDLQIYGFEPVPEFFTLAAKNLERFKNVKLYNVGLGAKNDTISMGKFNLKAESNYGSSVFDANGQNVQIPLRRLDSFKALQKIRPKLVKIDVEGQEDRVVEGMDGLIHDGIFLSLEADRVESTKRYIQLLKARKMDLYCGALAVTDRTKSNRDTAYDRHSTVHIFACFREPSFWMKRLLQKISGFDEYLEKTAPILGRR